MKDHCLVIVYFFEDLGLEQEASETCGETRCATPPLMHIHEAPIQSEEIVYRRSEIGAH